MEKTATTSTLYLYGQECLAERRDGDWAYYLYDGTSYVRQVADEEGEIESAWRYDPDGLVREGPEGPVSHLVCGGIYDVQNPASLDFPTILNIPHRARIQVRPEPASPCGVLPRKKAAGPLEPTAAKEKGSRSARTNCSVGWAVTFAIAAPHENSPGCLFPGAQGFCTKTAATSTPPWESGLP